MPRKKKTTAAVSADDARRYKLVSSIPIPPPLARPNRYPLSRMKVGQSFGFPLKEEQSVRTACSRYRKTAKTVRFTIRVDKAKARARIWRIE